MGHKLGKFPCSYMYTFLSILRTLVSVAFTNVCTASVQYVTYEPSENRVWKILRNVKCVHVGA